MTEPTTNASITDILQEGLAPIQTHLNALDTRLDAIDNRFLPIENQLVNIRTRLTTFEKEEAKRKEVVYQNCLFKHLKRDRLVRDRQYLYGGVSTYLPSFDPPPPYLLQSDCIWPLYV